MTGAVYIVAAIIAIAVFLNNEKISIPEQEVQAQAGVYAGQEHIQEESTSAEAGNAADSRETVSAADLTHKENTVADENRMYMKNTEQEQITRQTSEQITRQTSEQITTEIAATEKVTDSSMLDTDYAVMYKAVGTKPTLTIRKAPDNNGNVAGWLPEGRECEVLVENVGGWTLIRYGDCTGFVYGSYLNPVNVIK